MSLQKLIKICINKEDDKQLLLKYIEENINKKDILANILEFTSEKDINFFLNIEIAQGFYPILKIMM